MGRGLMDRWIGRFGVLGFVCVCVCVCVCCDKCLKEEMGMAKVGRGSLKSDVADFCWSLEIVNVWV